MKKALIVMLMLLLFIPCSSYGYEGGRANHLEAGLLYIRSADNFSTQSDLRIGSLGEKADRVSFLVPVVLFNMGAGYGRTNTVYFRSDIEKGDDFGLNLGTVIALGENENMLDLSIGYVPFQEAWKNPYQTGGARQETDVTRYSGKVRLSRIAGTPFGVRFKVARVAVDDDEIGRLYPSLAREGTVYKVSIDYRVEITPAFSVVPSLSYERGDLDGSSNSYDGYGAALRVMYRHGPLLVMPVFLYSFDQYDTPHPLFGETREDNRFAMFVTATISGLFETPGLYCKILSGYVARDSNIDFCDSEGIFAGLTVGYRF